MPDTTPTPIERAMAVLVDDGQHARQMAIDVLTAALDRDEIAAEMRRHGVTESYPSETSTHYVFGCKCGARDVESMKGHVAHALIAHLTRDAS